MTVTLLPDFKPNEAARHTSLSGIEQVRNALSGSIAVPSMVYQTFRLPLGYVRSEGDIPDITGLQLCFDTRTGFGANVTLQVNQFGDWVTVAEGSTVNSATPDQKEWVDIYFTDPIRVSQEWLTKQFRIGVQSDQPVWYAVDSGDNENADVGGGQLCYKLLAYTADEGEDFLSNRYRSMVKRAAVSNFDTVATDNTNGFWYSKPNPSKYAVESLYFDVRDTNHDSAVVDRILIDPITPGVFFNLYYSEEGDPGTTDEEWEQKLWTPIYQVFKLDRRQEFALPAPVKTKYMKVEFSHLQAQHYSPGTFSLPIRYKKHPKWVLDYFLARINSEQISEDPFIARRVRVVYDALKLGYDYYLDDLQHAPTNPNTQDLTNFLTDRSDTSDQIDQETMEHVSTELRPFLLQPASRTKGIEYLVSTYAQEVANQNYPVEKVTPAVANTVQVSQLDREQLVVEANYPVMFFYVPSRHTYRVVEAPFAEDRAYFVGIRELAFTREHYTVASDTEMYVDNLSDWQNVIRNDFLRREERYTPFDPNPVP